MQDRTNSLTGKKMGASSFNQGKLKALGFGLYFFSFLDDFLILIFASSLTFTKERKKKKLKRWKEPEN